MSLFKSVSFIQSIPPMPMPPKRLAISWRRKNNDMLLHLYFFPLAFPTLRWRVFTTVVPIIVHLFFLSKLEFMATSLRVCTLQLMNIRRMDEKITYLKNQKLYVWMPTLYNNIEAHLGVGKKFETRESTQLVKEKKTRLVKDSAHVSSNSCHKWAELAFLLIKLTSRVRANKCCRSALGPAQPN